MGYWVKRINHDISNLYDSKLSQLGLTSAQLNVLICLWNKGDGLTQKEIQKLLNISKPSLTNLLDTLVAGGWVFRKSHELDARVKRVFLTGEGKNNKMLCQNIINEIEQELQKDLTNEEISSIILLLKKSSTNLKR
jgi:MarR family transcriptional regulator, organic hydroperoxide resistance regulator